MRCRRVGQQDWAVVGAGGRGGHQHVAREKLIPIQVVGNLINAHQCRVLPLIRPSEAPILALDFLQNGGVDGPSELAIILLFRLKLFLSRAS